MVTLPNARVGRPHPNVDGQASAASGPFGPKKNADEFAFKTFNNAFGGASASRVNKNLREDKHWSYGAGSFTVDARGQRLWFVYAPVQTDKTTESVSEMLKELQSAVDERPISPQEATDRQTRKLAGRRKSSGAVLVAIQEIITFDLPQDYYSTFAERVPRDVTFYTPETRNIEKCASFRTLAAPLNLRVVGSIPTRLTSLRSRSGGYCSLPPDRQVPSSRACPP